MHRLTARPLARLTSFPCALGLLAALLPACSRTVAATYPGSHAVQYPWRACGMGCDRAFTELEASHDARGKDCEELIVKAEDTDGSDERVAAAALYDSALLLILRGQGDEAAARFARAEALDRDPEYRRQEAKYREAQGYLAAAPPSLASSPAPAPASAPAPAPAP